MKCSIVAIGRLGIFVGIFMALVSRVAAEDVPLGAQRVMTSSAGTTEIGWLNGVEYRIDVPQGWQRTSGQGGGLLVYYHGYSETPYLYKTTDGLNDVAIAALQRGYAVVQSSYAVTGWALEHAVADTEALREYFVGKYGVPSESILSGHSMGGALTLMTIEKSPELYDAALPFCGPIAPTYDFIQMRTAQLAAFEYYFPGLLPPIDAIPADYKETPERIAKLKAAVEANPKAEAEMTALTGVQGADDLAHKASYAVYVAIDLQKKSGGQPFDNRNLVYFGTSDDAALNRGVQRFAGDAKAAQYLVQHFTPTGNLLRPTLAVHTLYDRLIQPSTGYWYSNLASKQGHGDDFVMQYVERSGHCNFTPQQQSGALDELLGWLHDGKRPVAGLLK